MPHDVVVIGAGLAGLCSAHYLAEAGLDVCVCDAEAEVGQGASYANGGLLTPSMPDPWNAPGVQWTLLRWLGRADAPMLLRPGAMRHYLGWGLRFLTHANARDYQAAIEANYALSVFSLDETRSLVDKWGLEFETVNSGAIKVWRDAEGLAAGLRAAEGLAPAGLRFSALSAQELVQLEPLLEPTASRIAGGIHYPADTCGDALKFCQALHRSLGARGVQFRLGQSVAAIATQQGRICGLRIGDEQLRCQRVVVAAGAFSDRLLAPLGVACAVRPVKGYSLSVRIKDPDLMPRLPIIDDALHAALTPLGDQLRVAGTAEFSGWDRSLDPARVQNLWELMRTLNPGLASAADPLSAKPWCGLRPVAADGKPSIGATAIRGLYLNTGHGHLGWTQAAGSGRLLAASLMVRKPAINPSPYSPTR